MYNVQDSCKLGLVEQKSAHIWPFSVLNIVCSIWCAERKLCFCPDGGQVHMRAGAAGAVVRAGLFTVLCWAQCSHISVFLYLYFCVCVFVFVFCIVLQHLCKVNCSQFCVGHDAHTAHGTRNTLHTAHCTLHTAQCNGTRQTAQCSPNGSIPPHPSSH